MPSGGGSEQVVERTTQEPPAYLQPHLQDVLKIGRGLYDSGAVQKSFSPYPGSFVPMTESEMGGLGQMRGLAQNGSGISQGMLSNLGRMNDIAGGSQDVSIVQPGEANPYLMANLDTAANRAQTAMASQFGAMGRYGGAAPTGVMGREIGDLYSRGLGEQMNADLDRRMQGQALNAANRAGAINSYGQMAPGAEESRYWDAERLIDVGAAERGELQDEQQFNMDRWNATNQAPLDAVNWLNNLGLGLSATGGSTMRQVPKGSKLSGLLGGGLSLGGLLGSFF